MSSTGAYPRLVDAMDELRRAWRQRQLLEAGLLITAVVLGVVVLAVAADNLLKLGVGGRMLVFALLLGSAAVLVLSLFVKRWLEQRRDDFFAALAERHFTELDNRLINALQLGRGTEPGSPQIVKAIVDDASDVTIDLDLSDSLDWQPVRRAAMAGAAVFATLILYAILGGSRFSNGLSRIMLPFATIEPYTATRIDEDSIRPSQKLNRCAEGTAVKFQAMIAGVKPEKAELFYRPQGEDHWTTLVMSPPKNADLAGDKPVRYVARLERATRSFDFFLVAGDDRSSDRDVVVDRRPRVQAVQVTIAPPAYAGLETEPAAGDTGEVAALAGSRVQLTVTASKELRGARLVTESGQEFDLTGKGTSWQTDFVLTVAGAKLETNQLARSITAPEQYQLQLVDSRGHGNSDPVWRSISTVPDQSPTVAIPRPGQDRQVAPDATVSLQVTAKDDYGIGQVRVRYRLNDEQDIHELKRVQPPVGAANDPVVIEFDWKLADQEIRGGDLVRYWAEAIDRNSVTGPGVATSRQFSIFVITPQQEQARVEMQLEDFAQLLEGLIRLQSENKARTSNGDAFDSLFARQTRIRKGAGQLASLMKRSSLPLTTVIGSLNEIVVGPMAKVVQLFEIGRDTMNRSRQQAARSESLPVQDEIIKQLRKLLARLEKNQQARRDLRRLRKKDQTAHKAITTSLEKLMKDLERMNADETELANKLEKLPKRKVDEFQEEELDANKEFDDLVAKWNKWKKGTIDELTKLPTGFIEDFGLRSDVNSVFEEIEAVSKRPKTTSLEVALEDLGSSKATEMLENLEIWMPDAPDSLKWLMEEPLDMERMKMPEMPLPDALEDLIGELLQEAEDFEDEADDITSAWGDNLNQAGWGVSDGPISNFSAKGVTGNDLPNNNEVSGRSGDGRRGKSSGQMVGDTARGLDGRKTPARLNNERYEKGRLKEEGRQDPNGATGGGKRAGEGRKGLQGGTPPPFSKDMKRLSEKQKGLRERANQVAKKLDTASVRGRRLREAIRLLDSVENDLRNRKYDDAFRKRRVALRQLRDALGGVEQTTVIRLQQARDLPAELRDELLQSADDSYPKGYESLLESYYRALSETEK
ncbi:MAG: hypothetical protein QF363_05350 [Planctomycetaceae bacterium]|nr:hypothetical protein [Planctomycetaceae bacterium]